MNPKVDFFFNKADKWKAELERMRIIALDCGLAEELKWGCPCYTLLSTNPESKHKGNNVVLVHAFKDYCAFLFFKGALMPDPHNILIRQSENVQSARQVRFTNIEEITEREDILKSYIREAIKVEKAGLKVELKKVSEFKMAEEFQQKLDAIPHLKTAFEALTPGRQRAYLLYFSSPKQAKTREQRVEKCMQRILEGKGLNG